MECLFCKIVSQSKNNKDNIIVENEKAIAILDIFPVSDGHTLIITKEHFANIAEVNQESWNHLLPLIKKIINKLQSAFQPNGFNIITNMNKIAAQSVFHLHVHLIPKYKEQEGFNWNAKPVLEYSLDQVTKKLKIE